MPTTSEKKYTIDFKAVKEAVTIDEVLSRYGIRDQLKGRGDRLSGCCPIHEGTNPTQFRVSLSKNCWNCFGDCGRGGNVIDFVMLKEGVPVREAAKLLIEWFNLPTAESSEPRERPRQKKATSSPEEQEGSRVREELPTTNEPLGFELQHLDSTHDYLQERGLTVDIIEEFGLGYCAKGVMRGRIAIPIHNAEAELVGYAGRWPGEPPNGKPKYLFPKNFQKSLELFNLHRAVQAGEDADVPGPIILVEGFFDCFRLLQAEFPRTLALMGSSLSEAQEELLREQFPQDEILLILLDQDEAGIKGAADIAARLADKFLLSINHLGGERAQPDQLTEQQIQELLSARVSTFYGSLL